MSALAIVSLFGIYFAVGAVALVLSPIRIVRLIGDFRASAGLSYVTGAMLVVLGGSILLDHRSLSSLPETVAMLLGAGLLVEGALFMAAPCSILSLLNPIISSDTNVRLLGLPVAALAGWLLWVGRGAFTA